KEHLFADIFARDNLDYRSRELATIAALASMAGTAGQLRFHLGAAMNTGLTEAQLNDFISVLQSDVGKKEADDAREILSEVVRGAQAKAPSSSQEPLSIARAGTQPSQKGPAEYFTGSVRIDPLFQAKESTRASGAYV